MIPGILAGAMGDGVVVTDPHWASVAALLHFDGADGSTTFTDQKGNTWTPAGNAQIDTAAFKFGGASGLFDGNNDYLSATAAGLALGSGDFTIEGWCQRLGNTVAGSSAAGILIDYRTAEPSQQIMLEISGSGATNNSGTLNLYINGAYRILTPSNSMVGSAFKHWALVRSSGSLSLWIDGTMVGTPYASATNYAGTTCYIGGRFAAVSGDRRSINARLDDLRITPGVARYTSSFTPPTAPFPNS